MYRFDIIIVKAEFESFQSLPSKVKIELSQVCVIKIMFHFTIIIDLLGLQTNPLLTPQPVNFS